MATSVDQKMLRQMKFAPELNQKVDMQKVNIEVIKKWVAGKLSEILGFEDDVVIELCFSLLENDRFPKIKELQVQLTGFLEKHTAPFCKELWTLCLSAQSNPQGVPKELLEAKKLELIQEKIEAEKAAEAARKRREEERSKERDIDSIRQRERADRGRGRGRGGRGGRDLDRRPVRDSRSPPPHPNNRRDPPNHRGAPTRRDIDTYIPLGSRRDQRRRSRSPYRARSRSNSRSPPRRERRPPRRSPSRSATPDHKARRSPASRSMSREASGRNTGRVHSKFGDARDKTYRKDAFRSHSPREKRRRDRSPSPSRSNSLSPDRTRSYRRQGSPRRRATPSGSRTRSPRSRRGSSLHHRRSSSHTEHDRKPHADSRKDRATHECGAQPHVRGVDIDPLPTERTKRRRSMERYDPRSKRRRNTSSGSEDRQVKPVTSSGKEEQ